MINDNIINDINISIDDIIISNDKSMKENWEKIEKEIRGIVLLIMMKVIDDDGVLLSKW